MTDAQIKETVNKVLHFLHDPKNGLNARRQELRQKYENNKEYERAKHDLLLKVAKERAKINKYSFDNMDQNDMTFLLTGEDVVEKYFITSCGQAAKAFCYAHDKLVKSGEIKEPLDLKIMVSTRMDLLKTAEAGHTLPCVKMSDGKYHAFDPQIRLTKENPDVQFIDSEIKVGNTIYHLLKGIQGKPYKIMAIMPWKEYEEKMSVFADFLKGSTEYDKTTTMIISAITNVLKGLTFQDRLLSNIYNFCHEVQNTKLPIRVIMADKEGNSNQFFAPIIKIDGDVYYFMPVHNYLYLHKMKDLGDNKLSDVGSSHSDEYTLIEEFTPKEYVKWFESNVVQQDKGRE